VISGVFNALILSSATLVNGSKYLSHSHFILLR
jgi:hypothetical protein